MESNNYERTCVYIRSLLQLCLHLLSVKQPCDDPRARRPRAFHPRAAPPPTRRDGVREVPEEAWEGEVVVSQQCIFTLRSEF